MSTPNIDFYKAAYVRMCHLIEGYRKYLRDNRNIPYSDVHKNICKLLDRTKVVVDLDSVRSLDFKFQNTNFEKLETTIQKPLRFICDENLYAPMSSIVDLTSAMIEFVIFRYALFIGLQRLDCTEKHMQFDNLRLDMFQKYVIGYDADAEMAGRIVGKRGRWVRAFFTKKNDDLSLRDIGIMTQALSCELSVSVTAREDEEHA